MSERFICTACGTQFPPSEEPPPACRVCEDERQFVPLDGQRWTTLPGLAASHAFAIRREGELLGIGSSPSFGIGQRALLIRTPRGNVLWDCIALVDPVMVDIVEGLGGLQAIAISHPHFYTTMLEWSRAFGGVPVHLHARDRAHVAEEGAELVFWDDETSTLLPGLTLIRVGGHFEGGTILHWAAGAGGKGAILSGDVIHVAADRKSLGFMRSSPNLIPLGEAAVRQIATLVRPWPFDAIYGAFFDRVIINGARQAFASSVQRHLKWLNAPAD